MLHKKTISSNYNQNTNKKMTKIGKKTTKIGLAYVQFYWTNYIEVGGVEYRNCQTETAILTDFWQKTVKRSRKEVKEKSQKLTKKSRIMCQFSTWNAFSGSAKHCGINFRGWHFNIVSNKIYSNKEPN